MAQNLQSAVEVWFASIGTAPDYNTMHYWEGTGQSEFDINFSGGYISREHVKAFIRNDTTGASTPVALTFLTASRVRTAIPVSVGSTVCIYRDTPKNAPLALFVDGAIMNAVNFDRNAKQSVFAVAELLDRFDATNSMAEEAILRSSEAKEAAAQAALDAASAESKVAIAQDAATSAASDAANAATLAGTADNNASNALSVANGIDAKATLALSKSGQAVATAQDAEAVANAIDGKATTAMSQSAAAVATANTALTTANSIEGKADRALQAAKPVLAVEWIPKRAAMWVGYVAGDGQVFNRVDYPDAWASIEAGTVPVVADSVWLADPSKRGCYTTGNGSTTFRVPDYNGIQPDSYGPAYLGGSSSGVGTILRDRIQNLIGAFGSGSSALGITSSGGGPSWLASGVFNLLKATKSTVSATTSGTPDQVYEVNFDASRVARTGETTRPVTAEGCWAIRLFGVVNNPGQIDAATLATQLAAAQSKISELESWPQRGSNANGEWVKFKDGTLICTRVANVDIGSLSTYVNLFQGSFLWTFPAQFISQPSMSITVTRGTSATWGTPTYANSGVTGVFRVFDVAATASGVTVCNTSVMAVGRWK